VDYGLLTVLTPGLAPVNLWARLDYGMRDQVQGLWGTSATDVFAAAAPGVLHYNGATWSRTFQSSGLILMDVWGSTPSDVYVVGSDARVHHYDGTLWTLHTSGLSGMLAAVWGASPRDIFAVSWDGTVLRFDGARWSSMGRVNPTGFMDVWGTSARDVYTVGQQSALHFDGTSWNDISTGVSNNIEAVWGVSPTDIYAAGCDGNVFHYDGTGWTHIVMGAPIRVKAIWGSSATDVYFGGADSLGRAEVLHYDGTFWQLTRSPIPYGLVSIWGAPTGEVFASGNDGPYLSMGGTIVRGYRGGTVTLTPSSATITGNGNQLQLVTAAAAGGSPVTGVTFLWTSSDSTVAAVDGDGLVTGLKNGTAVITATAFGGVSATATVTVAPVQVPPVAVIDVPVADTLITRGESLAFQGTATDVDGTVVSHHWDFGDGTVASVEDPGPHTYANLGVYRVTYRVTDDDGASSPAASVVVTVAGNQMPKVGIAAPANGAVFAPGEVITFTGSATDHEDGALTGASLVWTSSLDGQIGTGTSFTRSDLSEGTHTIKLDAKDSYGWVVSASVTISVRSTTPLYLAYDGTNDILSSQPALSGYVTIWLYNYGSGQSTEFQASLGNAITGTGYGFSLWLGAGTAAGQTGTWTADILVEHLGARATLATNTFSVPYSNLFVQYTASVTGIAGGAPGDKLILRLTLNDVSEGAVRFGAPPLDSHILVPGIVTVGPLPAPARIPAAGAPGVRVEVSTGQSMRYPGR
jgi:PKD repeat protein